MHRLVGSESSFPQFVSVIMPARNAGETIRDQLDALAAQTYARRWELLVVDNGSTDDTAEIAASWRQKIPNMRVVSAREREGVAYAKNVGAAEALGDLLLFCDADDVATSRWIEEMVLASRAADIVRGRLDRASLTDQFLSDSGLESVTPLPVNGFLPFASGSNFGIRAGVLSEVGGWDETFLFSEDKELSWRVQTRGFRFAVASRATIQKRGRTTTIDLYRQVFRWGADAPQLYRRFRSHGMKWNAIESLNGWLKVLVGVPYIAMGRHRRSLWVSLAAERIGRLVGSLRHRVVFL